MRIDLPLIDEQLPEPPLKDDGSKYPYLLIHESTATFADSATELVGSIIPDYDDLLGRPNDAETIEAALGMRYDQAVSVATAVQAGKIFLASEAGEFDLSDTDEETLTALLCERTIPYTGLSTEPADQLQWNHTVPLVLIDVDYAPFTDRPRPTGRILWVRPSIETAYLESLDDLDVVLYRVLETV